MANRATVNSLVTIVRSRLNLTNMNTITDAELKVYIRSSLSSIYELVANRHRDYYVQCFKFSLAANQDCYPLPANFRSCIQVFVTFGSAPTVQRKAIDQFTMTQYQAQSSSSYLAPQWPTMYRIMGNSIYFTPTPNQSYTNALELWYVPQWTGPVTDDVSIDAQLPNGWETWVEYDSCVQVAMRLRFAEYYAMYSKEREMVEKAVIAAASIRDESPQYMTDSYDTPWFGLNTPGET